MAVVGMVLVVVLQSSTAVGILAVGCVTSGILTASTGIAFILLSLQMVGQATELLRDSALLPALVGYLRGGPLTAFLAAAVIAWVVHSSVATVLLFVTFASGGMLPLEVALPMVLGANLGGGIIAVWIDLGIEIEARRIPVGSLIFRGVAALLVLMLLQVGDLPVHYLGATKAV